MLTDKFSAKNTVAMWFIKTSGFEFIINYIQHSLL